MTKELKEQLLKLGEDAGLFSDSEYRRDELQKRIARIITADELQESNRKPGYSIWDYVSKDKKRPVLQGIHYEDGLQIATDGRILIIEEAQYAPEMENKTVGKDGQCIEAQYPNWKSVIPRDDYPGFEARVDERRLNAALQELKAVAKMQHDKNASLCVKVSNPADPGNPNLAMAFKAEELIKFCSWMRHRHVDTPVKFNSNGHTCKAACGKDVALIMPARPADDELIDVRLIED